MADDVSERRLGSIVFALIALLVAMDVSMDLMEGTTGSHAIIEVLVLFAALGGAALLWRRRDAAFEALRTDLSAAQLEAQRWRADARQLVLGLSEAIDRQFDRWELTQAERDVALLLLKGLSLKEVAEVRGTSERTAREQARSVYKKGHLSGRSELSAFFLEDLLSPQPEA